MRAYVFRRNVGCFFIYDSYATSMSNFRNNDVMYKTVQYENQL